MHYSTYLCYLCILIYETNNLSRTLFSIHKNNIILIIILYAHTQYAITVKYISI